TGLRMSITPGGSNTIKGISFFNGINIKGKKIKFGGSTVGCLDLIGLQRMKNEDIIFAARIVTSGMSNMDGTFFYKNKLIMYG
ncbi:MAG: hypothetical protein RR491_09585, partial [Lachnospiraceae bacterium]